MNGVMNTRTPVENSNTAILCVTERPGFSSQCVGSSNCIFQYQTGACMDHH